MLLPPSMMAGPCGPLQSDLLATWVGALGALGAFAVALYLAWVAISDRTSQQASLVSAYVVSGVIHYPAGHTIKPPSPSSLPTAAHTRHSSTGQIAFIEPCSMIQWALENRSHEMISDVTVSLLAENGDVVHQIGPIPVIRPSHEEGSSDFLPDPSASIGGVIQARVTFQDARGRRWSRVSGQRLHRVRPNWRTSVRGLRLPAS